MSSIKELREWQKEIKDLKAELLAFLKFQEDIDIFNSLYPGCTEEEIFSDIPYDYPVIDFYDSRTGSPYSMFVTGLFSGEVIGYEECTVLETKKSNSIYNISNIDDLISITITIKEIQEEKKLIPLLKKLGYSSLKDLKKELKSNEKLSYWWEVLKEYSSACDLDGTKNN